MIMARLDSGVNSVYFLSNALRVVTVSDLVGGLTKTLFFGLFITLIACHRGLATTGGTAGVGRATTQTVVISSITVIISDFVLTKALIAFGM